MVWLNRSPVPRVEEGGGGVGTLWRRVATNIGNFVNVREKSGDNTNFFAYFIQNVAKKLKEFAPNITSYYIESIQFSNIFACKFRDNVKLTFPFEPYFTLQFKSRTVPKIC